MSWAHKVLRGLVCYVAVFLSIVLVTTCESGCALFEPADAPRATAYGVELQLCVQNASSRAEADACRKRVDCRYAQGPCPDGGP